MKKINKFLMLAMIGIFVLAFSNCSKDDDPSIDEEELIGGWEIISSKGWEIEDGVKREWNLTEPISEEHLERWYFYEDNTFTYNDYYMGRWYESDSGNYEIKGNKLILMGYDYVYEEEIDELTIVSLTGNQLLLRTQQNEPDYKSDIECKYKRL
ncbi:MAG: lipocalin family protein [Muribaculaceae bacterium]|nr:lipocalin family protein [Muribaculaceae bacterium]